MIVSSSTKPRQHYLPPNGVFVFSGITRPTYDNRPLLLHVYTECLRMGGTEGGGEGGREGEGDDPFFFSFSKKSIVLEILFDF